jgi:hypothetical protein
MGYGNHTLSIYSHVLSLVIKALKEGKRKENKLVKKGKKKKK